MAKKKTSTGQTVNYVRTDDKKLKKTIKMSDVLKDEGTTRSVDWKEAANAASEQKNIADRASYYLSARNTEDKKPTFGERLGYGAKSILERTKATPDLLYQGVKGAVSDMNDEEYQAAKARRDALEMLSRKLDTGYHNEGVLAPGGEAVTQADIITAGIENAKKRENELASKISKDSYGYIKL